MFEKKLTDEELRQYAKYCDNDVAWSLLKKLRKATKDSWCAGPAGMIVEALGHLLSAYDNPSMTMKDKALIVAAIGYIICPVDLIPDMIPAIGWTDDLGVVDSLLTTIKTYSNFSLEELDKAIEAKNRGKKRWWNFFTKA